MSNKKPASLFSDALEKMAGLDDAPARDVNGDPLGTNAVGATFEVLTSPRQCLKQLERDLNPLSGFDFAKAIRNFFAIPEAVTRESALAHGKKLAGELKADISLAEKVCQKARARTDKEITANKSADSAEASQKRGGMHR